MIYGLYDTQDDVWLGDIDGPFQFDSDKDLSVFGLTVSGLLESGLPVVDDEIGMLGHIRAQMVDAQLKQASGRTRALEYTGKIMRLRDSVPVLLPAEVALRLLETGRL